MSSRKPRNTIGLILPNAANHYCITLIETLSLEFEKKGYTLLVALTGHSIDKERSLLSYYSKCTDGILIMSDAAEYSVIGDVVPHTIPVIFINRKPMGCTHTCIIENDYSAVYQQIFSLKAAGHEKIGCICNQPYFSTSREILRAYGDALNMKQDNELSEYVYYSKGEVGEVPRIVEELKEKGCTAIFAGTQSLTQNVLEFLMLYNMNLKSPIVVSGFANEQNPTPIDRMLDLVTQPLMQTIDIAVQQLIYRIHHPKTPSRDFILKGNLQKKTMDPHSL